jgi:hypothetical protein
VGYVLINFLNYILSPFYWVKIIKLIENSSNIEAYELLNKIHPLAVKKNYKYFYLKSYIELGLRQYESSLKSIKKGLNILDNNKLNDDEYAYLHKYAYGIERMIYKMSNKYKDLEEVTILEKKISYNINNVSKKIQDFFPI